MATPLDPYAVPPISPEDPVQPWSWVPQDWQEMQDPTPPGYVDPETDRAMREAIADPRSTQEIEGAAARGGDLLSFEGDVVEGRAPTAVPAQALAEEPSIVMEPEVVGEAPSSQDFSQLPQPTGALRERIVPPIALAPQPPSAPLPAMTDEERAGFAQGPEYLATQRAIAEEEAAQRARDLADERARTFREAMEAQEKSARAVLFANQKSHVEIGRIRGEMARLSREGVDNDRWWSNRSTGQKIAAYIAAIGGGLLAPYQGGRNAGLELIMREIDMDIEEQKFNLQNRRNLLGDQLGAVAQSLAVTGNMHEAENAARMASLQLLDQALASEQQQFAPQGTSWIRIAEARAEVQARQAKAEQDAFNQSFETNLKSAKFELEAREQARKEAETAHQLRPPGPRMPTIPEQISLLERGLVFDPRSGAVFRDPSAAQLPKTPEQRRAEAVATKEEAEAQIRGRELSGGPGGSAFAIGDAQGSPYRNKDGSTFEVTDQFRRQRISEINIAAQNIRRMADLVKILRAQGGGASRIRGSAEYQELKSLAAQVDFETYKAFGLGAPSAGDRELAEAARGNKDITSFIYSPEAGFDSYARGIEQKLNTEMRSAGYTGKPVRMPRIEKARALERSPSELRSETLAPIPPELPPEARAEVLESKQWNLTSMAKQGVAPEELRDVARGIDAMRQRGELTQEEAYGLVLPLAPTIMEAERKLPTKVERHHLQGVSDQELKWNPLSTEAFRGNPGPLYDELVGADAEAD